MNAPIATPFYQERLDVIDNQIVRARRQYDN